MTGQQTIKQVDRQLRLALADLGLRFTHYQEYRSTETGDGRILLGRHVGVYFEAAHVSRVQQKQVAKIFRKYWHRSSRLHSCQHVNVQGWKGVNREVTLTF